jgi:hypothetical protein
MRTLSRVLTIVLIFVAISATGTAAYSYYTSTSNSYSPNLKIRYSKLAPQYDYSCLQPIQGIYVVLNNSGDKSIQDFSVSVSNPLCKGAVPPLPSQLKENASLDFYVYSTETNGTITVSGNNTLLLVKF